ncbi:cytochrome c [Tropicimonas sp. TH_r6]|uniref:c-type cytochrome n=1 Tax=Tropicimonas sp. TH_r6 TaxID=3082085 RepID=UPI0029530951|nr:cytochrome c [Tropicimonas sp. TH_r6]MDV7144144.1 cytochrome c [Tropicimonas sp. TH_r6]
MKTGFRLLAALGLSALAATAWAHGGATGIVKERMDGMTAMENVMKSLAPMMKGATSYDEASVATGAKVLSLHSGEAITARFPEGSGGMPSEATDAIWSDWDEFEALALRLETLAAGLEQAVANEGGDMSGLTMVGDGASLTVEQLAEMPAEHVFVMIGRTCAACHKKFRERAK